MTEVPTTEPQSPAPTGAPVAPTTPPATDPKGSGAATEEKTVTLSEKDYKNLVSSRDKSNQTVQTLQESVMDIQARQEYDAKNEFLGNFLKENKDSFPDLTVDDLMDSDFDVDDPKDLPEAVKAVATKKQRRFDDAVQSKLMNVQKVGQPTVSPEQRAEKEKSLKANPTKNSLKEALALRLTK